MLARNFGKRGKGPLLVVKVANSFPGVLSVIIGDRQGQGLGLEAPRSPTCGSRGCLYCRRIGGYGGRTRKVNTVGIFYSLKQVLPAVWNVDKGDLQLEF
jgi:hypothetical protein